ncbi:MAG: hypothetical protein QCH35_03675 [Methanomicrobiaceae archaeon]|nr:hypothetical protein [Methanomicrobiaceae archaeon]
MADEKTTREMICETSRDVKWIVHTLERMEVRHADFEGRLRGLEGWKQAKVGEEQKARRISAGAGGIMGGVMAVPSRVLSVCQGQVCAL